jgi:RecB family endonuclease NucS
MSKEEPKDDLQVERLEINSLRRRPYESLKIIFNKVYFIGIFNLLDSGTFSLYASEEDMQKAIVSHPELIESGFRVIAYEKKLEPGFVDVYGIDKNGRFVVIEIKRRTAGKNAVLQLERYINALKNHTTNKIRAILVAPKIAKGVQQLMTTLNIEFKQLDPKKCAEILNHVIKENKLDSYV